MKTALYVRVSTDEQAQEGYSISAQKKKLEAYCLSQGWEPIGFYVDDGYSAKDLNRPEMKRLLKHVKDGIIDCVLVYRLDRLTRSVLDLYKLLEIFEDHDCKFKSATEVYDTTTAMGRMFITIVAALAQWERENLGERVRMGMQEKARQGKWTVSTPPFGYDLNEDSTLSINEGEAMTVQKIFDRYISGKGMNNIAIYLNKKGFFTKNNSRWTSATIGYVLDNPVYKGTLRYNYRVNKENYFETDNAVPAIVSEDTFIKAQAIKEKRKAVHPRAATSEFIFSGLIKCKRCGSPLIGKYGESYKGNKVRTYLCSNRKMKTCDLPYMSQILLEKKLMDILSDVNSVEEQIQNLPTDTIDNLQAKINSIQNEIQSIEKRRKKWQYAWVNEMISDEEFTELSQEENKKEAALKEQLQELEPTQHPITSEDLNLILADIKDNWNNLENLEKKSLLQLIIKKIVVDKTSKKRTADSIDMDITYIQ